MGGLDPLRRGKGGCGGDTPKTKEAITQLSKRATLIAKAASKSAEMKRVCCAITVTVTMTKPGRNNLREGGADGGRD